MKNPKSWPRAYAQPMRLMGVKYQQSLALLILGNGDQRLKVTNEAQRLLLKAIVTKEIGNLQPSFLNSNVMSSGLRALYWSNLALNEHVLFLKRLFSSIVNDH